MATAKEDGDTMADAKEDGNTDEALEFFCGPCKNEDEHEVPVSYCEECNEYLCKHCHKAHKRLAATRNHVVQENAGLLAQPVVKNCSKEFSEKCTAHPSQVIAYYCVSHNEFCCPQCLSLGHKVCKDVKSVTDYFNDFDVHQEENKLKCKMHTLCDEVSKKMTKVQSSIKAIENCHEVAQKEMLDAKCMSIDHIENLYSSLTGKLNKMREEDMNKIVPYRHKCNAVLFDMNTLESYFKEKTKYSKNQLCFAIKKADAKVDINFHEMSEVNCSEHLNFTRYKFIPNEAIKNIPTQLSSFGSLDIQNNVIKSAVEIKSLHTKDVTDGKNCCITGLALIADSKIVLTDFSNSSVKLIDTDEDKVISKLKVKSAPWDVTCVSNNKVAVTVPEKKIIELLTIDESSKFSLKQSITCTGKCYGITKSKDKLLAIVIEKDNTAKLQLYESDGTILLSVLVDNKNPQYVVCDDDRSRIYISGNSRHTYVYIVELSSEDFRNLDRLRSCRYDVIGMEIDNTGVLYYCNSNYNEIGAVKLDEKEGNERKGQSLISGIKPKPKCLAFCNETSRLFVGLDGNEIKVYVVF
ncbi:uncharacterized protein LOC132713975 [Ruditapes philippinarum]|uniref:uncharacterized protein LOC132713975 n=1 Tax=Ruditapes philippinarum TaxID=129788 RepID=UPI00295A91AF|nr:uncharacterized protein LOC132713975 [Ruditapes philippinarum]